MDAGAVMEARTSHSAFADSAVMEHVADIISSVRGTKPDYTLLASGLEHVFPFDIFGIVLLRHDRQAVRVTTCQRENGVWSASYHQHPLTDSMLEQLLQTPPPASAHMRDYPNGVDGPPSVSGDALSRYPQVRSTFIAPLQVAGHVLGTVELGSMALHQYEDAQLQRLILAVVRVLASAIENAQLGGNTAIQDRQRAALKDVTSALTSKKDLSAVLNQIVDGISQALSVSACILFWNHQDNAVRLGTQARLDQGVLTRFFPFQLQESMPCIISQSILRRQVLSSQDITHDAAYSASTDLFTALTVRSIVCYPLVSGNTVYGTFMLCSPESGGFTPLKMDIFTLFVNQATIAIHNSLLLTSVHQRNHVQEMIERLEQAHKQRLNRLEQGDDSEYLYHEEMALFEHVYAETQRIFGLSLSSFLRWISDQLPTRNERDLQAGFPPIAKETIDLQLPQHAPSSAVASIMQTNPSMSANSESVFPDTFGLLEQTAESALIRAAMLGELSRLILQLRQSTNWVQDAWFVIDLKGNCTYMNPAAEVLCETPLDPLTATYENQLSTPLSLQGQKMPRIEEMFSKWYARMRNSNEVSTYLHQFSQEGVYQQELHCVLADEPLTRTTTISELSQKRASHKSSNTDIHSDRYFLFTRYPLYTQPIGQLEAHALRVQNVTEQVRDEKNRSAFLSAISHDLRTPLTTIKAAVTGLLQKDVQWDPQDRYEMLEDINSEADHLTNLVNSLVELSRIEMGSLSLEKEWCDVGEVFSNATRRMKTMLGAHPLVTRHMPHLPLIYADHNQLKRVFTHLLAFAAHRSPEQSEILVIIDTIPMGQEKLRVRIIDQGPLLPEQERKWLFTSYRETPYDEALALSISKGIVEAHQGTIWVEETEEHRMCFTFTLPIHTYVATNTAEQAYLLDERATFIDESGE